jgi:hypothetical protein
MQDPFAHLSLEEIQNRQELARELYPVLWWVAEFVVFVRGPSKWVRGWYRRRRVGYRG